MHPFICAQGVGYINPVTSVIFPPSVIQYSQPVLFDYITLF
jgi:hypothetical protein